MYIEVSTELEAVNEILSGIGESPINTLEDTSNIDAANALRILRKNSKILQQRGWSFNTFKGYKLNPDSFTNKIRWNPSILVMHSPSYIKRGKFVYDKDNNSFLFTTPIEVDITMNEAFEDLPEVARRYIVVRTMKEFQTRYLGVPELVEMSMREEQEAWADLQEYDMSLNQYNMLQNPSIQNNLNRSI